MNDPNGTANGTTPAPFGALPFAQDDRLDLVAAGMTLWRRRFTIGAVVFLGCAVAAIVTLTGSRVFEATVTLSATPPKIAAPQDLVAASVSAPTLKPSNFKVLFENPTIAAETIIELGLDKGPNKVSTDQFLRRVISVEEREPNVLLVSARAAEATLAAKIVNRLAERAVDSVRRADAREAAASGAFLKEQVDQLKTRLDGAQAKLLAFRQQAHLEVLEKQVQVMVDSRARAGTQAASFPLLDTLYRQKADIARLEMEASLAEKAYVDAASRYELGRLQVASRSPQLQIMEPAFVPDAPLRRGTIRNVAAGGFVGFVLAAAIVLSIEAVRKRATGAPGARPAATV